MGVLTYGYDPIAMLAKCWTGARGWGLQWARRGDSHSYIMALCHILSTEISRQATSCWTQNSNHEWQILGWRGWSVHMTHMWAQISQAHLAIFLQSMAIVGDPPHAVMCTASEWYYWSWWLARNQLGSNSRTSRVAIWLDGYAKCWNKGMHPKSWTQISSPSPPPAAAG